MATSSSTKKYTFETLDEGEVYWRDHYDWLLESGYQLRPRYKPDWVPTWKANPALDFSQCEDSTVNMIGVICDAIRLKDNSQVILKKVDKERHRNELEVHTFLSETSDPNNHAIPIIEILNPPDSPSHCLLVTTQNRDWDDLDFDTGFKFLHENLIAHRDIKTDNILMEATALSQEHFHLFRSDTSLDMKKNVMPKTTRTEGHPRYYIIDFGLSRRYDGTQNPPYEITPVYGTDTTVPEFRNLDEPHNPFPIDVYCLGNMVKIKVLGRTGENLGFQWLLPLLDDMTKEDPEDRPTMEVVMTRFSDLTRGLKEWKLRSKFRLDWDDLAWYEQTTTIVPHWWRKLRFTVTRTPAIPTFKPVSDAKPQEASKGKDASKVEEVSGLAKPSEPEDTPKPVEVSNDEESNLTQAPKPAEAAKPMEVSEPVDE
ncbi:hypothetical protein D9611_000733 [Ephemerocybe angulata]|uniref:Protein kinase domain-containing protein n=1 Tax=Ephemerocybe angulata TaxID=980116 RepID=A0A8H5BQR0_9AGAR|nr:hypothetical protein D9611_000733 [Tulosesus angulatus]